MRYLLNNYKLSKLVRIYHIEVEDNTVIDGI